MTARVRTPADARYVLQNIIDGCACLRANYGDAAALCARDDLVRDLDMLRTWIRGGGLPPDTRRLRLRRTGA